MVTSRGSHTGPKLSIAWLGSLAAMFIAFVLVACGDTPTPEIASATATPVRAEAGPGPTAAPTAPPAETPTIPPATTSARPAPVVVNPTAAPTSAPTVTVVATPVARDPAASVPTVAPSPTPAPRPVPTPDPVEQSVAYAADCAVLVDSLKATDPQSVPGPGEAMLFGELAQALDEVATAVAMLEPPTGIRAYHEAWVAYLGTYSEYARGRPGTLSVSEDEELFASTIFPRLLELAHDDSRTEEEKEQRARLYIYEQMASYYGQDYVDALVQMESAKTELAEEAGKILEESGCSPGILGR